MAALIIDRFSARVILVDSSVDVVGFLAGPELDDAELSETVDVEGIFGDDGFDLLAVVGDGKNDPAISGNLPAGDQKVA